VRSFDDVVVSALARVEVAAAIQRKRRLGELSDEQAAILVEAFAWEWASGLFAVVAVADAILAEAARAAAVHPLRAYDAVQLASALAARRADPDLVELACFDDTLAAAARAEAFRVVP
jgi:predicted nucleic acid-binding protein